LVQGSGALPGGPLFGLGVWLNVQLRLRQTDGLPALDSWRVGRLPLPTALAQPLLQAAAQHLGVVPDLALVAEVLQQVQFGQDALTLVYVWRGDTAYRVLSAMTPPAEQLRLRAYSDLMVDLTAGRGPEWRVDLASLIGPLFELAQRRSLSEDAALENRAAILTLALYTTGRGVGAVVPAARAWPRPLRVQVVLHERDDFPQHFMVSAMLAIEGTSPLTRAIGLHKEMVDARSGSGFSFNDLAANRAGQRFGEMALAEPARLQAALARGVSDASLMPDVADLPEFLSEAEFARRYGRVGSAGYNRVLADIEARLNALGLYR
ncbi:MAG: hypothetical protein H7Z19_24000, partial [Chitinophagaceae bacterium]|nr:hypothetical protein [Rubrivivax sp.]